jgi:hypothetical protein
MTGTGKDFYKALNLSLLKLLLHGADFEAKFIDVNKAIDIKPGDNRVQVCPVTC